MSLEHHRAGSIQYEPPGLGDINEDDPYLQADLRLTVRVQETLDRHYPGHPWMVQVSHGKFKGIKISIPVLMGATNVMWIPIQRIMTDPGLKCVVKVAGEILERYRIPRQAFSLDHFIEARDRIPAFLRGYHGFVPK